MIAETKKPKPRLSDEKRAARIEFVDLVDGIRADGRSVAEAVSIVAARPPFCTNRGLYICDNYLYWRKSIAKRKGAPPIRCQAEGCGKLFQTRSVKALPFCPEHVQAEKRRRWKIDKRRSLDAKAVRAGQEDADKRLAKRLESAQGACKPAAEPVQPPCKPPAESATPTSDLRLPTSDLAATAVEQAAAIVRGVIEAIMDARPVRYELIGRAAEIGRELDREINELAALVADAKTTREG